MRDKLMYPNEFVYYAGMLMDLVRCKSSLFIEEASDTCIYPPFVHVGTSSNVDKGDVLGVL